MSKKITKHETEALYKTDIEEHPYKARYLSSIQRLKSAVFMKKLLVNIIRVSRLTESQVA